MDRVCYDPHMPEILKEITDWNVSSKQPNHTYLIGDSGRIIAYAPWHGTDIVILKSQMKIDKRYRKFIKTKHIGLTNILAKEKKDISIRKFKIKSKDKEYIVSVQDNNYSCTCLGFTYRGQCKHTTAVANKLQAN